MLPVRTKLTLLILALPISILVLLDLVIFYYYKTLIVEVSNLLTTIAVLLLVWERLRDSLSKKLEYLHKNSLFKLYKAYKSGILYFWQDEVKGLRLDLERYGKFMGIYLYPKGLLKKINRFLISYEEFDKRLFEIDNIGKKYLDINLGKKSFDLNLWRHLLGIKSLREADLQKYTGKPIFKLYADKANIVKKEQAKLIEETKNLLEEEEKMEKEIFEKLEDFLKSNNLSLEKEPSYIPYP